MANIDIGSLINYDNIQDFINDALGIFGLSQNKVLETDGFAGRDIYRAVVISDPKIIEPFEYEVLGGGSDSKADRSYKKFKARIVTKNSNPHAVLEDPCDLSTAKDRCEQNALVSAHTTIVTQEHHGLNIGSFIEIGLSKFSNGTYNLQTAKLIKVLEKNETGQSFLNADVCQSIKRYFKYGDVYEAAPPIEITTPIREAAQLYDITTEIPGWHAQQKYVTAGKPPPAVKHPFDYWLKALIYLAWAHGLGEVVIISGYRTQAEQEELHRKYLARKAAHPKDKSKWGLPAACGTCSRHINGFAVDVNFYDHRGTFVNSSSPKEHWEPLVNIATQLGLTWGGTFGRYDPVHFELNPKEWGDDLEMYFEMNEGTGRGLESTDGEGNTSQETLANQDQVAAGVTGLADPAVDAARAAEEALRDQIGNQGLGDGYDATDPLQEPEFNPIEDFTGHHTGAEEARQATEEWSEAQSKNSSPGAAWASALHRK